MLKRLMIAFTAFAAVTVLAGCAEPKIDISKSQKGGAALSHPKVPTAPPTAPPDQSAEKKTGG